MKEYVLPRLNLSEVLCFSKDLKDIEAEDTFVFDITKVQAFDPLAMLMVGSSIREFTRCHENTQFFLRGADKHTYAGTMGFFKYVSPSLTIGKKPGEAIGSNNYIPITEIDVDELAKKTYEKGIYIPRGDIIEKESARLANIVDRGNKELHKLLTYLIREILRNTPEHAHTNKVWVCGQYWPSYKLAEIAIIDEGIGIFNSLTSNIVHKEYIKNNEQALQWALKAGISTAFVPSKINKKDDDAWSNSGFGLYMISKICQELKGSFCIISYDDYILMDNHGIKKGKTSFTGTAIRIRIPSINVSNAQQIINKISKEGENEAKTIRTAFKEASVPSKGLMTQLNIEY